MIYLESELQDRLLPAFHYALKPNGILFLSPSESIGGHPDLFAAVNRKWKFYRAVHAVAPTRAVVGSGLSWTTPRRAKAPEETMRVAKEINFAELARRALLQSYAPASVVADLKGNILYVHGDTGKYLRPAPGQATLNVVDMAREGLQLDLRAAIHAAANNGAVTLGREVAVKTNGDLQTISLNVRPLADPDATQGLLLVSFQDVVRPLPAKLVRGKRGAVAAEGRRVDELERDLAYTRENLQATIEEQQSSNEELQSTNEELQSTNEELQSTNEELETSKEELQSVNEELVTVNAELQAKIEQLAGMQNDMKNLLDNISVGTVFLDERLVIRRFTREAVQVYRLVESDTGRPLVDIKSNLEGEELLAKAQSVLDTLVPCEQEVQTVGGAKYLARIQPYRTLDNVICGVVLTFTNISARAEADAKAQAARLLAENIIDTVREPLLVLDAEMKVISASRAFYRRFRFLPEDVVGHRIYELGDGQWDIPSLRELLDKLLPQHQVLEDYAMEQDFPVIGHCRMLLNARRIVTAAGQPPLILVAMEQAAMP
jgi:two-component system CheB/CheR fusion protein